MKQGESKFRIFFKTKIAQTYITRSWIWVSDFLRLSDSLHCSDFSFKVLKDSSIKAVFNSFRIVSNTSFVAAFLNIFRSNVSKKKNLFLVQSSFLFSFPWFLLLLSRSLQFKTIFKYDYVQTSRLFLVSFVSHKQKKLSLLSCM